MLKKKIASAVAALAMAATMSVSALSASAACVHNPDGSCVGNGHFYAWDDLDEDGVVDEGELTLSTHADGLINGNPVMNSDGTITITLQQMTYHGMTGYVSSVLDADGYSVNIADGTWTLTPFTYSNQEFYNMTLTMVVGNHPYENEMDVVFMIGDCTDCNCGC